MPPITSLAVAHDLADPHERVVFNHLWKLDDTWKILWGFHYTDEGGETREGDFLVLGPEGGLLVLEVKGSEKLLVNQAGQWTGKFDNPFVQLDRQWQAVMKAVNGGVQPRNALVVLRALAVPNISRGQVPGTPHVAERGSLIFAREDLHDFQAKWKEAFSRQVALTTYPNKDARERFLNSQWGQRITQHPERLVGNFLDAECDRFARARFPVLDHLPSYRRFAISGPAGSGKTWLLMEIALRWARTLAQKPTGKLLLLCYNHALADSLKKLMDTLARKGDARALKTIEVRSWEDLVREVMIGAGLDFAPPVEPEARNKFYRNEMPTALALAVDEGKILPNYDALVVDEAQDHDTTTPGLTDGWWTVYGSMLRDRENAPIAVAFDQAQRLPFAKREAFDTSKLLNWIGPAHVDLSCPNPIRYSPRVAEYLATLAQEADLSFTPSDASRGGLESPPVEVSEVAEASLSTEVRSLVGKWISEGRATADDILIITKEADITKLALIGWHGNFAISDQMTRKTNLVGIISAGRCKGLESRAVIVAGFEPLGGLSSTWKKTLFLAASRARQLLAVVNIPLRVAAE